MRLDVVAMRVRDEAERARLAAVEEQIGVADFQRAGPFKHCPILAARRRTACRAAARGLILTGGPLPFRSPELTACTSAPGQGRSVVRCWPTIGCTFFPTYAVPLARGLTKNDRDRCGPTFPP